MPGSGGKKYDREHFARLWNDGVRTSIIAERLGFVGLAVSHKTPNFWLLLNRQ